MKNQYIHVTIWSSNQDKILAVKKAFEFVYKDSIVTYCEENHATSSQVNNQPIGKDEIITGARNRIKHGFCSLCDKITRHLRFNISIESGLIDTQLDVGCVLIQCDNRRSKFDEWIGFTDTTSIPQQYIDSTKMSNYEITAGQFIVEDYQDIKPTSVSTSISTPKNNQHDKISKSDWHLLFSPKTRVQMMCETTITGLYQLCV